ncbi:AAA family ATPase [Brevibacillus dissolubilis]|uniref:AAA family ATPase n=1 Tax=Brevibacillus dissolubilis TaxID=1844116 RepID=UPI0011171F04|nr:ATP-binding protein [Brevibacillus dissolubilis]
MPASIPVYQPYTSSWEHYQDECRLLDLMIRLSLLLDPYREAADDSHQFRGLIVTPEEIEGLLRRSQTQIQSQSDVGTEVSEDTLHEIEWLVSERVRLEAEIQARLAQNRLGRSQKDSTTLPLPHVAEVFGLTAFEQACLFLCLSVEIDRKYEKVFGYLQDDITIKHPTVDLALRLFCQTPHEMMEARMSFAEGGKLTRFFLKKGEEQVSGHLSLSRVLRLDERMVHFFLHGKVGHAGTYGGLAAFASLRHPDDARSLPPLLIHTDVQEQMLAFMMAGQETVLISLTGPFGSGKKLQMKHLCQSLGLPLLIIDVKRMVEDDRPLRTLLEQVVREAMLHRAVLCVDRLEMLLAESESAVRQLALITEILREYPGMLAVLSQKAHHAGRFFPERVCVEVSLPYPTESERKLVWETYAKGYGLDAGHLDFGSLASTFRFTPGQIGDALLSTKNLYKWYFPTNGKIGLEQVHQSCYKQIQHRLQRLATKLSPRYTWEDIVLPDSQKDQLRQACNQVKYRHIVYDQWGFNRKLSYGRGISMLFAGPPGTGKTMSAEVIARELGLEIYKIDLSRIVSKYIGETEKHLHEVFAEAGASQAILFFDEMDALFGKRSEVKDSHDKYANLETSYLLQKMEEYEGITVLATNFLQNVDEAFLRRISYIIKFPFPDAEYREQIWRFLFPEETPLDDSIDFALLAEKFQLTGGHIKNIVVSATFLAAAAQEPVRMSHIIHAAKHELAKSGKVVLTHEWSDFFQ